MKRKNNIQKINFSILLHDIRSVQNVASIFRMAECLGVNKIYLSGITPGPVDRFGREREDFLKISLGTEKVVEWTRIEENSLGQNPPDLLYKEEYSSTENKTILKLFLDNFKKENGVVIGLEQVENSVDYKKVAEEIQNPSTALGARYLIIPGGEVEGLGENILEMCDMVAEIPQYGRKESLNIFSSMSIACFRFFDQ